jgi:hypothetical protein
MSRREINGRIHFSRARDRLRAVEIFVYNVDGTNNSRTNVIHRVTSVCLLSLNFEVDSVGCGLAGYLATLAILPVVGTRAYAIPGGFDDSCDVCS